MKKREEMQLFKENSVLLIILINICKVIKIMKLFSNIKMNFFAKHIEMELLKKNSIFNNYFHR